MSLWRRFRTYLALRIAPWLYTEEEAVEWVTSNMTPWEAYGSPIRG